jgi:Sulfotransferase domain
MAGSVMHQRYCCHMALKVVGAGLGRTGSHSLKIATPGYADRDTCIAAYEAHNDDVRRTVVPEQLIEWTPSDGWGPLCEGLNLGEPDVPFPHVNTTNEFHLMTGLDQPTDSDMEKGQ